LTTDSWRDRTADSIAKAIDTYFAAHLAGARAGAD
jgi:N-acetylmuramoyl-L-alanine amidase